MGIYTKFKIYNAILDEEVYHTLVLIILLSFYAYSSPRLPTFWLHILYNHHCRPLSFSICRNNHGMSQLFIYMPIVWSGEKKKKKSINFKYEHNWWARQLKWCFHWQKYRCSCYAEYFNEKMACSHKVSLVCSHGTEFTFICGFWSSQHGKLPLHWCNIYHYTIHIKERIRRICLKMNSILTVKQC